MTPYQQLRSHLGSQPRSWLVTGVAGFIGSNLLEALLKMEQRVIGLDNFATGNRHNLDEVRQLVTRKQWSRFYLIEGDIRELETCRRAMSVRRIPYVGESVPRGAKCSGDEAIVDYVLLQAALGSVPRSIEDPVTTNSTNIDGFLNILVAARDADVKRLVYAASSSRSR